MDAALEKSCLEEINHTVLDAREKISVRVISNNYGLDYSDAVRVLQRWIDNNCVKTKLTKDFIVRGVDTKLGTIFITVADEKRIKTIESRATNVSSMLYSVSVASESSRGLGIQGDNEIRNVNLPLKVDKRDIKIFTPANPPPAAVKQEPKSKINSMFTASATTTASKPEPPKPTVKEEKESPPAVKQEPVRTASQKSPNKKKDDKKAATGKGSIASFFSNKPLAAKPASSATSVAAVEVKAEKLSPKDETNKQSEERAKTNGVKEETQRWKRMISDSEDEEVVPNTPQEKKEAKKGGKKALTFKKGGANKGNPSKKSRILEIEDSSEDEDEDKSLREPEERLVKFETDDVEDVAMIEDEEERDEPSSKKSSEKETNGTGRRRAKVKKLVTKTFMDDEGYLTTVKEYEMVSASEDEADETINNNNATKMKESPKAAVGGGKIKSESKAADKKTSKVTPPTPKTKQGSIMSFFSKK